MLLKSCLTDYAPNLILWHLILLSDRNFYLTQDFKSHEVTYKQFSVLTYKYSVDLSFFHTSGKCPWAKHLSDHKWALMMSKAYKLWIWQQTVLLDPWLRLTTSELTYNVILSMEWERGVLLKLSCPDTTHPQSVSAQPVWWPNWTVTCLPTPLSCVGEASLLWWQW